MSFTYKAKDLKLLTYNLYCKLDSVRDKIENKYLAYNEINRQRLNTFKSLLPKYKFTKTTFTEEVLYDYFGNIPYIEYEFNPNHRTNKGTVTVDFIKEDVPQNMEVFITKDFDSIGTSSTECNIDYMYFNVYYYEYKSKIDHILGQLKNIYNLCSGVYEVLVDKSTRVWLHNIEEALMEVRNL